MPLTPVLDGLTARIWSTPMRFSSNASDAAGQVEPPDAGISSPTRATAVVQLSSRLRDHAATVCG